MIFELNLFLGYSVLGWIVALVRSLRHNAKGMQRLLNTKQVIILGVVGIAQAMVLGGAVSNNQQLYFQMGKVSGMQEY